jgi:glycosyltransferase involved in cell wall biosynthesis
LHALAPITDAAPMRRLITQCDALLMPERYGEVRTLTLEAMGNGMAVIAAHDPALDMLIHGRTAAIVRDPDTEEWFRHLRRVLLDAEEARRLGASARAYVIERHQSSDQARALVGALEKVLHGGALPFAQARRQTPVG